MTHRIAITALAFAALTTGCGYRYVHAVTAMETAAAAAFSCEEPIEVLRQPPTAYTEADTYRATGCGRAMWFECEGEGDRMTCGPRGGAAYSTPHPNAPHAIVKVGTLFHTPLAHRFRRHELRIDDALIRTVDTDGVRAIPVAPGPTRIAYRTAEVDIVRELRPFTWRSSHTERRGYAEYRVTQYHTGLREISTPVERSSCAAGVDIDARPGATYRVLYQHTGANMCRVYCLEERMVNGVMEDVDVPCA